MTLAEILRQMGLDQGLEKARQQAILGELEDRFFRIPDGVAEAVEAIEDSEHLRRLLCAASDARSIEDFTRLL